MKMEIHVPAPCDGQLARLFCLHRDRELCYFRGNPPFDEEPLPAIDAPLGLASDTRIQSTVLHGVS
jgi:hypothetical protein